MFSARRVISLCVIGILGVQAAAACASGGSVPARAPATKAERLGGQRGQFSQPAQVDNRMFPLVPGMQFVYSGTLSENDRSRRHSVVFTVTDLTKMIHGVRTVVALDRDFLAGHLQEQELAFFAQDDAGNVWNFGEYPEEYRDGKFTGAPSTWIRGSDQAYGGIHMLARPAVGRRYREGLVPPIEFDDVSRIAASGQVTCMRLGCFREVLVVDEWSPNDPASGHQIKYYSPGVGLVRVGARGGDSREFLALSLVRYLGRSAMAAVRAQTLAMDRRAFRVNEVYRVTKPAVLAGQRARPSRNA